MAALTIAIRPCPVDRESYKVPVIFFFATALFYAGNAYLNRAFTRLSGIILVLIFLVYIAYTIWNGKRKGLIGGPQEQREAEPAEEMQGWKMALMLVVGAAAIAVGANLLVENGTKIAEAMGVPETVIALTFVALGTSLPELVTAITSLVKGHSALSLGNIIGANLFNLVLVSGVSFAIQPFSLNDLGGKMIGGMPSSLVVDIPVMFVVMLLMTVPALVKGKLSRIQGILLLCIYAGFCIFQFVG